MASLPSQSGSGSKPFGSRGGPSSLDGLHLGQGMPAPPQRQACGRPPKRHVAGLYFEPLKVSYLRRLLTSFFDGSRNIGFAFSLFQAHDHGITARTCGFVGDRETNRTPAPHSNWGVAHDRTASFQTNPVPQAASIGPREKLARAGEASETRPRA